MIPFPHSSNLLLASLSDFEAEAIVPHLHTIELPQGTVLFNDGDPVGRVYFPQRGVVSLVVDLASGKTIETGMIGRDSLVDGLTALDGTVSLNRAIIQVAGAASVLSAGQLRIVADQSVAFRATLIRHGRSILAQSQQSAACNAEHGIEARLARWLLRCRDLVDGDAIHLTQEFLAQMLGITVTVHLSIAFFLASSRASLALVANRAFRQAFRRAGRRPSLDGRITLSKSSYARGRLRAKASTRLEHAN
jgi:CRP-like cAMP-binding protein